MLGKLIVTFAAALTLAGNAMAANIASHAAGAARAGTVITAHTSRYGMVLFDGNGRVLYLFGRDRGGKSSCTGACASAWPPFLTKSAPRASAGVRSTLLGTTRRSDGTLQVTYAGHPLYYFQGDVKPGQIKCQNVSNFGGLWLVLKPNGAPVL